MRILRSEKSQGHPVTDCPLQPEVFSEIVECCLGFINEKKLSVYDESTHTGILRHIYIRKGHYSDNIMVCFVVRKNYQRQLAPLADALRRKIPGICSIIGNVNPDATNVILGSSWFQLYGTFEMSDTMCGNKIQISPRPSIRSTPSRPKDSTAKLWNMPPLLPMILSQTSIAVRVLSVCQWPVRLLT